MAEETHHPAAAPGRARHIRLNLSSSLLHVYNPNGIGTGLGDALPESGARGLEAGSWSAAVVDELAPAASDIHVAKYRMSGFGDNAAGRHSSQPRRHHAAVRRCQPRPMRAVYVAGRELPRLGLRPAGGLRRHHLARLLRRRHAVQRAPVLRLRRLFDRPAGGAAMSLLLADGWVVATMNPRRDVLEGASVLD